MNTDMGVSSCVKSPFFYLLIFLFLLISAGAMDTFARGLRSAAKIIEDGSLDRHVKVRDVFNVNSRAGKIEVLPSLDVFAQIYFRYYKLAS